MTIRTVVLALFTMSFGLLFMLSPETLTKMSEGPNKKVREVDKPAMGHRVGVDVVLMIASLFLLFYSSRSGMR